MSGTYGLMPWSYPVEGAISPLRDLRNKTEAISSIITGATWGVVVDGYTAKSIYRAVVRCSFADIDTRPHRTYSEV